jgi:hypothetical protein
MTAMRPDDHLHRVLFANAALGVLVAALVVATILGLDIGLVRTLMLADPAGMVAFVLLATGFTVTCASVMMGGAIMLHEPKGSGPGQRPGQPPGPPKRRGERHDLVPVRVKRR